MSVIVRIDTAPLHLPLRSQLRWGQRSELSQIEHVLVRVLADDGALGVAEAPVRPTIYGETRASVEAAVADVLSPALIGADLHDDHALDKAVSSLPYNYAARGALDIAVHVARAKQRGEELVGAYGGPRAEVRVSYILGIDAPERMIEEALRVAELGVRVLKVKVGRDHVADVEVMRALGDALADTEAVLYADANEAYDPAEAPGRLERLASLGVAWVEEPLPTHLLRERAALRREAVLPIIADDCAFTMRDLERELAFDTFDILNVKPARTGFRTSLAMIDAAVRAGKGVMIGSQASSGLGTVHAAVLATRREVTHPSELSFPLRLERDALATPLRYDDGFLRSEQLAWARLRADVLDRFPAGA